MADLGTYYCDMYRGHGNIIHGMRGVRIQLQEEEQNIRQPSRMALNSRTAVQPAAAGRDRDAGCSVLFALLLLL